MPFPTSSPAAQGVAASGVDAFLDGIEEDERIEPHGLIIQRHGHRIVEGYWAPHTPERLRLVYSLSKTFTGTALGLQLAEGRLSLDDLVSDHLPEMFDDDTPPATRRMKIRHIASMSTGHDRETFLEALTIDRADVVRGFLQIPPDAEPGTLFAYNQPPVLTLATILQRLAGQRLSDYLRPRVLDKIAVRELRWAQFSPGLDMGFSGVHTNLDAIARLGQLYLDGGTWNGEQILSAEWVANASRKHIDNPLGDTTDWQQGYGIQVWMSQNGYRGDGAFGQYMVVLPEHDAVVAMFCCVENMQTVLDLMWQHLVPAMGENGVVLADTQAENELSERLANLRLATTGDRLGGSPIERATLAGFTGTFVPAEITTQSHRSITSIEADGNRLVVREGDESLEVTLTDDWHTDPGNAVSSSATMTTNGGLAVDLIFLETPHRLEVELDPTTSTFTTTWPLVPLFGAGPASSLGNIKAPIV